MSPMTVRWKPLIVLSGLCLVIAALGLVAFALTPGDSRDLLSLARAEWKARKYDRALIQFRRALQKDPRNAEIHEDMARMYAEWAEQVPARRAELRAQRLRALAESAKYGKQRVEPRRALLADALLHEEAAESAQRARELIGLMPKDPDAHYALAQEALDAQPPRLADAREHLAVLVAKEPKRPRTGWVRARVAQESRDEEALAEVLEATRSRSSGDDDPIDRMARLRLRALDAGRTTDPAALAERVEAIKADAEALAAAPEAAAGRTAQLGRLLDGVQAHLGRVAGESPAGDLAKQGKALERVVETIYGRAIDPAAPDPKAYLAYAEHLLLREDRDRALEVVAKALALPATSRPAWAGVAMSLREVGIKAALLDPKDPKRFDRAAPYIKELIAASDPLYQGVGHLFQGVIELEQSGVAEPPSPKAGAATRATDRQLQASALKHLKVAAADLPRVATAQALYGVALLLSREPALGRQYLQAAQRLGNLEPRYQVWAAWSMLQAGYPEEAEPIVTRLAEAVEQGRQPRTMEPMLHLLRGEIYQARRTPADLRKARDEYQKAVAAGQIASEALQLRMAQVEILLGERASGERRLAALKSGRGGPGAEALAVLLLRDQKKNAEAHKQLADARRRYPDSDELVSLDAALRVDEGHADQADRVLSDHLAKHPDRMEIRLARARLLAGPLNRPEEARKLLLEVADGDNSAPLVQLASLELQRREFTAAARTIAQIRARWKEAAAADLLDAQLALAREDPRGAVGHLDEALRKDPNNKVALFWKAQLDDRAGASAEAAKIYDALIKDNATKELADGVSLAQAAQWALASMALENQDPDGAIARFQALRKGGVGAAADRQLRWQLALARAAKGQLAEAKAAVEALLADPNTTPSERVQAANFFRLHKEDAAATAQLDRVLKEQPGHAQAVAIRALMLADAGKAADASALIRRALAAGKQPPSIYLMLAATENLAPPLADAPRRALAALGQGLEAHPGSVELIRAKYLALKMAKDPGALAFVERCAKADPAGPLRRLLVDTYRDEGDLPRAEALTRALLKDEPKDARLASTLVDLVAAQAGRASERGDRDKERSLNAEALSLIRRFRKQFPADVAFPQAECELAARRGDLDQAAALTQDIDKLDKNSPVGPLLRAQIATARGWLPQAAEAYAEALSRSPRRADIRLALAQASLALGRADEALRQADWVLQGQPSQPLARVIKARALAAQDGPPAQVAARRDQAVRMLEAGLKESPKAADFYHQAAEIRRMQGRRTEAVATLERALKAIPDDHAALALAVQYLTEPRDKGQPPSRPDVQRALALAEGYGADARDKTGDAALALAVGFQKAGQYDLALPWAEKAAGRLDRPIAHLTYGDLLLSKAEATTEPATARAAFERAVAEYDRVLKVQANSIEAINNKAWILHRYLNNNAAALALAEALYRRSDPESLPPEFLDTLGAIQEAMNKPKDAEDTYARGLRKAPEFAMLNYHMGRLIAADRDRAAKAVPYLEKARAGRDTLPVAIASEVDTLLAKVGR
jgi:cellulose synthase operon protein C